MQRGKLIEVDFRLEQQIRADIMAAELDDTTEHAEHTAHCNAPHAEELQRCYYCGSLLFHVTDCCTICAVCDAEVPYL